MRIVRVEKIPPVIDLFILGLVLFVGWYIPTFIDNIASHFMYHMVANIPIVMLVLWVLMTFRLRKGDGKNV